ncbi:tetratricopeptide repeat protein [bacterium]|nr:tetratricopeptide repeat protein [bacterium]
MEQQPSDPYPLHCLGVLLSYGQRYGEAEQYFLQALEQDESFAPAYDDLGRVYMRQSRFAEAIPLLEQALLYHHDMAELRVQLAICREQTGDLDGALQEYQRAVNLPLADGELHFRHAALLERSGQLDEAAESYRKYLDFDIPERLEFHSEAEAALQRLADQR